MGRLIVIEGVDASGKATQTKLLYEYLKEKAPTAAADIPMYGQNTGIFVVEDGKLESSVSNTLKNHSLIE